MLYRPHQPKLIYRLSSIRYMTPALLLMHSLSTNPCQDLVLRILISTMLRDLYKDVSNV